MADTMERFMSEFNNLHHALMEKSGSNDDFFSLLKDMEDDPIVSRFKDELHIIRKLRNILIHEKKTIEYDIAMPSEEVVNQLIFIRQQLIQPYQAGDYFSRKVFSFSIQDSFERLLYFVNKNNLYQFPIFDEDGLAGILSHNGITNWLANHYTDGKLDLSEILIKDIVADETTYYQYEIISPATSLFEVEEMFFRNLAVGRSQYLILLAEVDEIREWDDIKGIITPWDLPKVLNLVQFE
ncbi:MAG TPA: CBS domain-containing protein [Atopostipes sp.]|nr:CBS domain-containing protein [Atopostipes sp.]